LYAAPAKSIGKPIKIVGAPIEIKGIAYQIERRALVLVWRGILQKKPSCFLGSLAFIIRNLMTAINAAISKSQELLALLFY
jgi:hypothetical protein